MFCLDYIPFLTFSKEYVLLLSSSSLPFSLFGNGLWFHDKNLVSSCDYEECRFLLLAMMGTDWSRPKLLLGITRKAWFLKNLYEGIGKLPRQLGLQAFVDSWQRESAAIKRQKSQQSLLHGAGDNKKKKNCSSELPRQPELERPRYQGKGGNPPFTYFFLEAFADS